VAARRALVCARLLGDAANISTPIPDGKDATSEGFAWVTSPDPVARLVQRAKEGDRDAFGELYRIHHPAVYRLARFYLGRDAEDAVSDTFLRAWIGLPRYRVTGAPFVAWLYGIARHVVADELARRRRTEPWPVLPERSIEMGEDDRLALTSAVGRLPKEQRQVIELKYLVGMTNPEVAAALHTTVGAVNAKQWRALRKLRELLGEP
jgi:RNA polymerase sigma-70 factor (ECF subfamily)